MEWPESCPRRKLPAQRLIYAKAPLSSHLPRAMRSKNSAPRVQSSAHMATHTPTSPKRGASRTAKVSRTPRVQQFLVHETI